MTAHQNLRLGTRSPAIVRTLEPLLSRSGENILWGKRNHVINKSELKQERIRSKTMSMRFPAHKCASSGCSAAGMPPRLVHALTGSRMSDPTLVY